MIDSSGKRSDEVTRKAISFSICDYKMISFKGGDGEHERIEVGQLNEACATKMWEHCQRPFYGCKYFTARHACLALSHRAGGHYAIKCSFLVYNGALIDRQHKLTNQLDIKHS